MTFTDRFHPESILTPEGTKFLSNFVRISKKNINLWAGLYLGYNYSLFDFKYIERYGNKMIKEAIEKIVDKQDLSYEEAYSVMNEIMDGETSAIQNAAFLRPVYKKYKGGNYRRNFRLCSGNERARRKKLSNIFSVREIVGTRRRRVKALIYRTTAALVTGFRRCQGCKAWKQGCFVKMRYWIVLKLWGLYKPGAKTCFPAYDEVGICFFFCNRSYHVDEIC